MTTYTVKRGDTLSAIAARYNTTYQKIAAANGIKNANVINVGQKLTIPGSASTYTPAKPAPAPAKPAPAPAKPAAAKTYTVRKGDTLSGIAARNNTSVATLVKLNNIKNANVISVGQVIKLPGAATTTPTTPTKPTTPTTPSTPSTPTGSLHANRESWFISQFKGKYNTNEDTPNNGNCGPTSLTMVAKAFGKINPSAGGADAAIEESRRRMGDGNNEYNGTSVAGIARGAKSYGLDAKVSWNAGVDSISKELAKGRSVIVHGTYIRANGTYGGGHYYVVTAIKDGKAYLNDPAWTGGPRVVPVSQLLGSIKARGTYGMISIGK